MPNLPVDSREYKLMLNVDRFKERGATSESFLELIKALVDKGADTQPANGEKRRMTSYLDTRGMALRRLGFSLRLREEVNSVQVNLKCRSSDRYVSAATNVSSPEKSDPKFEEDILPPFVSRFSHSNTVKKKQKPPLDTIGDAAKLFPGLGDLKLDLMDALITVNEFKVVEIVRDLCTIRFGTDEPLECGLSFWYLADDAKEWPLIAEFSFSYKALRTAENELEEFPPDTIGGADRLFAALQKHNGWIDPNGTTKTAFAVDT